MTSRQGKKSILLLLYFMIFMFWSVSAVAVESHIIDGDGLLTDDQELIDSVHSIGLCHIVAGGDAGQTTVNVIKENWPWFFDEAGAFDHVELFEVYPPEMTPEEIISLGQAQNVDALICGNVVISTWSRDVGASAGLGFLFGSSAADQYAVSVAVAFQLYDTTGGNLIWERTIKKNRTVDGFERFTILDRFSENIAYDIIRVLVEDGIEGDGIIENAPPEMDLNITCVDQSNRTFRISGVISDPSKILRVLIGVEGQTRLADLSPWVPIYEVPIDIIVECGNVTGNELSVTAIDIHEASGTLILNLSEDDIDTK